MNSGLNALAFVIIFCCCKQAVLFTFILSVLSCSTTDDWHTSFLVINDIAKCLIVLKLVELKLLMGQSRIEMICAHN